MSIKIENLTHIYSPNGPFEKKALDNVNLDCILGTKKDKVYQNFLEEYEK